MKFLVFSDLHQNTSQVPRLVSIGESRGAEFTVCLGDITDFGTGEQAAEILSEFPGRVYAIPGNCDPLDLPQKISGVAVDMHGRSEEIAGRRFVGLGGSNITIFNTAFELEEDALYDGLKENASEGMVLMTHVPSHGILDQIPSGLSVGSPAVRRIVEEYRPILAMSGHIHEAIGTQVVDGTTFVNPGPAKDGYCAVIEVNGDEVRVEMVSPADNL